jgi:hypothetical protein
MLKAGILLYRNLARLTVGSLTGFEDLRTGHPKTYEKLKS